MIIYPAIDLRKGRCVRLRQGDPQQEQVFSDDPAEMALRWTTAGATWLHIVNLDGAFESRLGLDTSANIRALGAILHSVETSVQFGGGIRSFDDMDLLLEMGVDRMILGTAALLKPHLVRQAIADLGADAIAVGIDARNGQVATHGWTKTSTMTPAEVGRRVRDLGVVRIIFTDIGRDGMLQGVNVEATARLAKDTGLRVIASGGVASMDDLRTLSTFESDGIEGVIIGQALYTGAINLTEALNAFQGKPEEPKP